MPVEALGHGRYRYGSTGKIYAGRGARTKAEKQGRAIEFRKHASEEDTMKVKKVGKDWKLQTNNGRWVGTYRHKADALADIKSGSYKKTAGYRRRGKLGIKGSENPSGTTILVIGAGVTLLGVAAYFMFKKPTATTQTAALAPIQAAPQLPGASLPATANVQAASNAVALMKLGHQAEVTPAAYQLSAFQRSVGIPVTGTMDPTTRMYLNLATPAAASLPSPTILG